MCFLYIEEDYLDPESWSWSDEDDWDSDESWHSPKEDEYSDDVVNKNI